VVESQRAQLGALAKSVETLWEEKDALANELVQVREQYERQLTEERHRADEAELRGRTEAARIIADAEEQASRLRQEASQRVGDAADRLESVLRVREQLLGELRGILDAYQGLLEGAETATAVERGRGATPGTMAALSLLSPASNGDDALPDDAGLFPREVELDAGPFADFAELAEFERVLARIPKVEDVYIVSFGDERARIELRLTEETPLVHELTRLPYDLRVTPEDGSRLTLQVTPEVAAG
jgi:hypothetical protein